MLSPRRALRFAFPFRVLAALPLLLAAPLAGCGGGGDAEEAAPEGPAAVAVEVVEVRPGAFEDVIELTGTVKAPEDAILSPEAAGTLTYLAPLGASVRRGATVAQVSPGLATAQVAQAQGAVAQAEAGVRAAEAQRRAAQSQLDLAQDLYRRQQPLVRDSILSAAEFRGTETQLAAARATVAQADAGIAQARGAVSAARANLQAARVVLGNTRVVAPFSGIVEEQIADRGQTVGPGTPVLRLVSGGGLRVEVGVPERYAGDLTMGTPVRIEGSAAGDEGRGGRVVFIGQAVDPNTRTFPVEVALDNSAGPLRPAMVVRLAVSRAAMPDALVLPQSAVVRDERGTGVLVVAADSGGAQVARYRPVTVGATSRGRVVITEGLRPGDLVVANGRTAVAENDRVRVAGRTSGRVEGGD